MDQQSQEPQSRFLSALVATLGCLGGLIAFTSLLLFFAAIFTPRPRADGSVIVDDTADALTAETEAAIRQVRFPEDTPAVVRTVSSIPREKIGTFATDMMADEPHWQTLRPRGWLRKYIRQDLPSGRGVYVLVSLDPQLLQIRYGREIRLGAYQQMLATGTWYRDQQRFDRNALNPHVLNTIRELAGRMHKVAAPPWPLSWALYLASSVESEIEDFLAPSDGLFSSLVLKHYILLARTFGGTGSTWRFVAFTSAFFILLWLAGKKLLINRLLLPRIGAAWLHATVEGLSFLGLIAALVTAFASLAALSKGRVEDQLALEGLGLGYLSTAGFDVTLFSRRGGLLLAIIGFLISLVNWVLEVRRSDFKIGFESLAWACALFLLPKAIAIAVLITLIWKTGAAAVQKIPEKTAEYDYKEQL